MIDTLKKMTLEDNPTDCILMTLHRPSNVDDKDKLFNILNDIIGENYIKMLRNFMENKDMILFVKSL